ncbi:Heavy metal transport/detoxification superfamily protein [Forsythia ovata]|uniref:Heavy metal transport/detoxification superfamily protein n=1 Tax=Forsythia ovata TaxID=205694 RepID=A0ABD1TR04_9LAMI
MHCEACARKVRRCLQGFEGVEDVSTDCKTSKVVVQGEKADPLKVLARVQRKSHRQVELLSPIPPPPSAEQAKKPEEKDVVKAEEKKEEPPKITVLLRVYMHCEACSQEIRKRIQKMKGVESAEPDLKSSQVTVKGMFEPESLVNHVYKRTGKQAAIIKVEVEKKEEEKAKDEKKAEESEKELAKKEEGGGKEKKDADGSSATEAPPKAEAETVEDPKMELKKNEFYYYQQHHQNFQVHPQSQRFVQDLYAYPPQMFSDENPNACSVM